MDDPSPIIYFLIILLLGISAFFSCSRAAISNANKLRLRKAAESGNKRAKTALALAENHDKTLFTAIICNSFANIAAASLSTVVFIRLFGAQRGPMLAIIAITVIVIIFCDILPRSLSGGNEKILFLIAAPVTAISRLLSPLTWLLIKLKNTVWKPDNTSPTVTEDELIYMLDSIEEEGVIEEQERNLVQSALEFDEVTIREIFTPRVNIAALDVNSTQDEARDFLLHEGYSRIPVYEDSVDNIIGILIARDYLRLLLTNKPINLRQIIAEPLFVHRTMKLSQLLAKLRTNNVHMAVVADDYGGTLGIVTMEDVLEELVGEIWDEDEKVPPGMVRIAPNIWEVNGSYEADNMFEEIGEQYDIEDSDYNTVNGWAGHIFGNIASIGETAVYKDLELTALEMDSHRIQYLRIVRITEESAQCHGEDD